nr:acyl-CoA dehydrogenase [Acidovorax sp.]
ELPYWVADDYLRAVALVLQEWAWRRIAATSDDPRWQAPAHAFAQWVLPEFDLRAAIIRQRIAQAFESVPKMAASA